MNNIDKTKMTELLSLRHPAPVADERAEVALVRADMAIARSIRADQTRETRETLDEIGAHFRKEEAYEKESLGAGGSAIAAGRWNRYAMTLEYLSQDLLEPLTLSAQPSGALEREKCETCGGTGNAVVDYCSDCNGTGKRTPPERAPGGDSARPEVHYERTAYCLMEMMKAYERRIRSDCTTPEQLAARPWECAEYVAAADVLKRTWPWVAPPPSSSPSATADATLRARLAPFSQRQREYIELLTGHAGWQVSAISLARDGEEETLRAPLEAAAKVET